MVMLPRQGLYSWPLLPQDRKLQTQFLAKYFVRGIHCGAMGRAVQILTYIIVFGSNLAFVFWNLNSPNSFHLSLDFHTLNLYFYCARLR